MGQELKDANVRIINVGDIFLALNKKDNFEGFTERVKQAMETIDQHPDLFDMVTGSKAMLDLIDKNKDRAFKTGVALGTCVSHEVTNILMAEQMKAMASAKH